MAKTDNLIDFLKDLADAIREKKGTSDPINAQDFADEIKNGGGNSGSSKWTGHADAEGLRAIGWTDEDIAYYQEYGVNWNAEDDEYHKVTDDNKALYGVLTANNISSYASRIVYLPKIDTSQRTAFNAYFRGCNSLVAIPKLDVSSGKNFNAMFECKSLICVPELYAPNATNVTALFSSCYSLRHVGRLVFGEGAVDASRMFTKSYSLVSIGQLEFSPGLTSTICMFQDCCSLESIPLFDTSNVTDMDYMFDGCYSLVAIPQLDTGNVADMNGMFYDCYSLTHANIKNAKLAYQLNHSALLSKESLLYLINNEAATSAITIKLASYAYTRLANDADIVAALANHPNISLAK